MILLIVLAAVLIAAGIAAGGLLTVVVGIHREERAGSLTGRSPGLTASGARAINGVCVRRPGILQSYRPPAGTLTISIASQPCRAPASR
jgi:hypothetical protein